jgi:chemotaxis protein CheD
MATVRAIGIGEWRVTNDREEVIKTFALGSCLAVIVHDRAGIGGMVHVALPDSTTDADASGKPEAYYADRALPVLFAEMLGLGSSLRKIQIKLVGAADSRCEGDLFNIGKRNILAVKRLLWSRGLGIVAEDTGGVMSRTVEFRVGDGCLTIRSNGDRRNL